MKHALDSLETINASPANDSFSLCARFSLHPAFDCSAGLVQTTIVDEHSDHIGIWSLTSDRPQGLIGDMGSDSCVREDVTCRACVTD